MGRPCRSAVHCDIKQQKSRQWAHGSGESVSAACRVSRKRGKIVGGERIDDIGHRRHAAADAFSGFEILQCFQEIILPLT